MSTDKFDDRHPAESELLGFDFADRLAAGETLTVAAFAVTVFSGVDAGAAALGVGPPVIVDTRALQRITGGVPGVVYKLTGTVTTSAANVHVWCGTFRVIDC